jgi:hypothetical protein
MYTSAPGPRGWFGHPTRLTVAGRDPAAAGGNGHTADATPEERPTARV